MRKWIERFRDFFNWGWLAYRVVWVLVATGVASAIGGGVWAVLIGVPLPIAIMAAYCTMVGSIVLLGGTYAYQRLLRDPKETEEPAPKRTTVNLAAWRLVEHYTLGQAAQLWCDMPPTAFDTHDSLAWLNILKEKVGDGTLKIVSSNLQEFNRERGNPSSGTKVTRTSLQEFAKANGFDPAFLRNKD